MGIDVIAKSLKSPGRNIQVLFKSPQFEVCMVHNRLCLSSKISRTRLENMSFEGVATVTWSEFANERSVLSYIRDNSFAKQMCSVFISRQRIADGMR